MNIFISCFRKVWFSKCQYKEYYNKFFKQFRFLRKYFFIDSINMGVLFWCQKSILIFYQWNSDVHVIIIILFFFYWITNQPLPIRKNKWKRSNKKLNLNLKKILTKIKDRVKCCYCCLINEIYSFTLYIRIIYLTLSLWSLLLSDHLMRIPTL